MTDVDRILRLLEAYGKSTLLVARRLNSLERAMQDSASSHDLWANYVRQLGLAKNPTTLAQQLRVVREDQELEDAIAELSLLLTENLGG